MWPKIYYFVMVQMVYAAFAVLVAGTLFKLFVVLFSKKFRGSLKTYPHKLPRPAGVAVEAVIVPSAWRKSKVFWFFIILFHIAVLLLVLGHLELIREFKIIQVIPHTVFLGAGAVGIVIIVSVLYFLIRRFSSPWREISIPEDFFILLLLFVTSVIGSHLHMGERYGMAQFGVISIRALGKNILSVYYPVCAFPGFSLHIYPGENEHNNRLDCRHSVYNFHGRAKIFFNSKR